MYLLIIFHIKNSRIFNFFVYEWNKCTFSFAANKIKLKLNTPKRSNNKRFNFYHPRTVSRKLNSKYLLRHDSKKLVKILKKEKFDLGIIAGARIIKKSVIECFKIGILNLHPGLLPINRGLDTHKWAVLKNWPQCVTAHLIDEKVDMGKFICKEKINVYLDDTLVDINYRLQSTEIDLMLKSINILKKKIFKKIKVKSKNLHIALMQLMKKR